MTEEEWQTTAEVRAMLLEAFPSRIGKDRKMRLLSCAFARSVIALAQDPRARELLSIAERCVEDPYSEQVRSEARREMSGWYRDVLPKTSRFAVSAIYYSLGRGTTIECQQAAEVAVRATDYGPNERSVQAALTRDIVGNPFRPVAFDPRWRSESAVALASAIYAERAFDRMPILADALEESGCDHPDVLNHCRDPQQVHARGCWVVDLVLGKQ